MKRDIASIRRHADAIRRLTAELTAELSALPPLTPDDGMIAMMHEIAAELKALSGMGISIDVEVWHFGTGTIETDHRIYLADLQKRVEGTSLEDARAKAVDALRAAGRWTEPAEEPATLTRFDGQTRPAVVEIPDTDWSEPTNGIRDPETGDVRKPAAGN